MRKLLLATTAFLAWQCRNTLVSDLGLDPNISVARNAVVGPGEHIVYTFEPWRRFDAMFVWRRVYR